MAIQYGNTGDPFVGLTDAVAKGIQLRSMTQRSEFAVSDPDDMPLKPVPKFDTTQFTKDTESQNEKYSKIKKDVESTYSDKLQKDEAYSKQISDPVVLGAAKNGINPKMIESLNKEIKQGNFKEASNIAGLMLDKIGKGTPEGQAFKQKIDAMTGAYKEYQTQATAVANENKTAKKFAIWGVLDSIDDIERNPQKYQDPRSGLPNKKTVEVFSKKSKYMMELGGDGYAEYLKHKEETPNKGKSIASRGTRLNYANSIDKSFENNKWTDAEAGALHEMSAYLKTRASGDYAQDDANMWKAIQKKWKVNTNLPATPTTESTNKYGF